MRFASRMQAVVPTSWHTGEWYDCHVRDTPGLQNVEGCEAARAIAAVAKGEPLWSNLKPMQKQATRPRPSPTHPDVLVWDTSRVDSTLVSDSPTGESTRRYHKATDAADDSGPPRTTCCFRSKWRHRRPRLSSFRCGWLMRMCVCVCCGARHHCPVCCGTPMQKQAVKYQPDIRFDPVPVYARVPSSSSKQRLLPAEMPTLVRLRACCHAVRVCGAPLRHPDGVPCVLLCSCPRSHSVRYPNSKALAHLTAAAPLARCE